MTATDASMLDPALRPVGGPIAEGSRTTIIQKRTGWVPIDWRELAEHWELLYFLVHRDVKVRYKQTALGVAWAVLQPVLSMVIFALMFGRLAKLPSENLPYPVFVFVGLIPWTFFATAVSQGSMSLVNQQPLLTKIYLPRIFIPASTLGGALVDMCISFGVLAVVMLIYGVTPGWGLLAVPALIVLLAITALGGALALSAITVKYRDFRFVIPFMIQVWMFASPVIYPLSMVPEKYRWLMAINPMSGLIDAFRSALVGKSWNLPALAISGSVGLIGLAFGLFYFRRTERRFADIA